MSHVPLPNVATFIISPFSVFRYLKTLLAILFLRDKTLEKTISVGVRAAEPTLRSWGSVKFRAYFLGWCYCGSAKERSASFSGLEMKETKNIQPSYVWETPPALPSKMQTQGRRASLRTSAQAPTGHVTAGPGYQSHRCPSFLLFIFWLAINKRNF